jgi:hypothetical protein
LRIVIAHAVHAVCSGDNFRDKGTPHPDVEKHAKAREADNVHRR